MHSARNRLHDFSKWLNVELCSNWNYSPLMPRLPVPGTGVSPLLQWQLLQSWCRRLTVTHASRARVDPDQCAARITS
jgi:hypothetical protein